MSPDAVLHAGAPTEDPAEGRPDGPAEDRAGGHAKAHRGGRTEGRRQEQAGETEARRQEQAGDTEARRQEQAGDTEARRDGADTSPPARTAAPTWTLVDRGNFVVGMCDACGYTSPARRARFSAVSDMQAHEILCEA